MFTELINIIMLIKVLEIEFFDFVYFIGNLILHRTTSIPNNNSIVSPHSKLLFLFIVIIIIIRQTTKQRVNA
jgi:hypothetical protein